MTEEHVEAIRSVYERWAEGDFRGGVDLFDPLITFVLGPGFPDAGDYHGIDEVAEYMRGLIEPWVRLTIEAEELIAAGDSVVAAVRQRGVGGTSGAATSLRYCQVWSFRGPKVIRLESFRERSDALAAVGLSE